MFIGVDSWFQEMLKRQIIFLVGPTAVGKSDVALELAKKIGAEIISCDSMQIYRGLNILSNKPSGQIRQKVKHHLIDIIPPYEEFSAADFRHNVLQIIKEIHFRENLPLIVGGTGLYVKSLIDGIFEAPKKDERLRSRLLKYAEKRGAEALHRRLEKIDPASAEKVHPNDLRRVVRALEVFELTKTPMSELKLLTQGIDSKYHVSQFGLRMSLQGLYKRIDARVEDMFNRGLVREVRSLIKGKKPLSLTASMALGIKEAAGYINGDYDLDEAKRLLSRNTRRYSRRQMTWFKADKRIQWIDIDEGDSPQKIALKIWKRLSLL